MRLFITLLISLLLKLSSAQQYCSSSFTPLYCNCTFNYYYSDPTCEVFMFTDCTWEECVQQQVVNNHTTCIRYGTKNDTSWNHCTSRCCVKQYPLAYESLQQCQDDLKSLHNTIVLIVLSIIGAVILIVVVLCVIRYIRRKTQTIGCKQSCYNILTCQCLKKTTIIQRHRLAEQQEPVKGINWAAQKQSEGSNKRCGTCYQSGGTVRLECQHVFHRQCARSFMRNGGECTICRKICTREVKIYCEYCKKSYFRSMLGNNSSMNPHFCPTCEMPNY